jgi:sulfate transport system permease protein
MKGQSLARRRRPLPLFLRWLLIGTASAYLVILILLPLGAIFQEALAKGWKVYWSAISHPDSLSAIAITLQSLAIVVPLNMVFGLAAAWAITKYRFPGKGFLLTVIDLPFSISPVIAGMVFILVFGANGWFGPALEQVGWKVIFAKPGIILATAFVTLPFVVRELVPVMQSHGTELEEAAYSLGAGGWEIFWKVTLPNIRIALLYGLILCQARAMGEFGAASVVSGYLRGKTVTLPLYIEVLFADYQAAASFACASLLTVATVATIFLKMRLEARAHPHHEHLLLSGTEK